MCVDFKFLINSFIYFIWLIAELLSFCISFLVCFGPYVHRLELLDVLDDNVKGVTQLEKKMGNLNDEENKNYLPPDENLSYDSKTKGSPEYSDKNTTVLLQATTLDFFSREVKTTFQSKFIANDDMNISIRRNYDNTNDSNFTTNSVSQNILSSNEVDGNDKNIEYPVISSCPSNTVRPFFNLAVNNNPLYVHPELIREGWLRHALLLEGTDKDEGTGNELKKACKEEQKWDDDGIL